MRRGFRDPPLESFACIFKDPISVRWIPARNLLLLLQSVSALSCHQQKQRRKWASNDGDDDDACVYTYYVCVRAEI